MKKKKENDDDFQIVTEQSGPLEIFVFSLVNIARILLCYQQIIYLWNEVIWLLMPYPHFP